MAKCSSFTVFFFREIRCIFNFASTIVIAPKSVLEQENEEHNDGRNNGNLAREHVGTRQVLRYIEQTTFLGLRVNLLGEPEESRNASA